MPNPSNAPHETTTPSPWSPGKCRFHCPRPAKIAVLIPLMFAGWQATTAQTAAPAAEPTPTAGFPVANLRPALANVQTAVANLSIARWKIPAAARSAAEEDVASIQRDLTATLPGLMTEAEARPASGPAALSPSFALFRNLDALYDVLLRVTETASFSGSAADASNLEAARAGLADGRAQLGTWLLQSIGAQDAQIAHSQAPAPPRPAAAPAPPTKIVVDDGPDKPKPHKKKPPTTQAPQ